ncbi:class I SAM-dependent methyltransferase [Pseudomonas sp. Z8(2022)]|uniref:class I SAM-dependent methyltransferase n=1 Tax=Pseudomonas sp. Z8(2022) TaxID=2962597 RepID=UPI0021F45D2D|nr:class I SAM-dependent methyltransferase [Pseudomonas sp. Z8(2022)]UYP28923.1 class I SAM-dependent methyltransferase [Pseudomonas sp. Z8(2022)]
MIEDMYEEKNPLGYFDNIRMDVISFIDKPAGEVLEIGCGAGGTLSYLKSNGLAQHVVGIDIASSQIEVALRQGVDEAFVSNLDDLEEILHGRTFDAILMLDVLEHLVDPWSVLKRISGFLRPGGRAYVSLPNVQSVRVLVPLLMGQWRYKELGILDKTHLRFFTKRTAVELLRGAGFELESVHHKLESHTLPRLINFLTLGVFKRYLTVQYILVGRI